MVISLPIELILPCPETISPPVGKAVADGSAIPTEGTNNYSIFVGAGRSRFDGFINHGPEIPITISGGVVTVTGSNIRLSPEGGVADSVSRALGGEEGDILFIQGDGVATITVIDSGGSSGYFILAGGANFAIDSSDDIIQFKHDGTDWIEVSRSGNS